MTVKRVATTNRVYFLFGSLVFHLLVKGQGCARALSYVALFQLYNSHEGQKYFSCPKS